MTEKADVFRKAADECYRRANLTSAKALKADLLDTATRWHWLAAQMAEDCGATEELDLV